MESGSVRLANTLLVLCLVLMVTANVMIRHLGEKMDAQTAILMSIKEGVKKPMSTTYTGADGAPHTINTPYQSEGLARQHKIDLCKAFNGGFPPSENYRFEWWSDGMDCDSIR